MPRQLRISPAAWPVIISWLEVRHGAPFDPEHVPGHVAADLAKIIREADVLDFPPALNGGAKAWNTLAEFFEDGAFTIHVTPERVVLDDNPIISGPPLPGRSKWKYAENVRAAERDRENRRSGIRLAPSDLDKLLELSAWRGARLDGRPTQEDLEAIRRDIERARVNLANAEHWDYPHRSRVLQDEENRLRRAEDPRAVRVVHPSGAVLIWLPI